MMLGFLGIDCARVCAPYLESDAAYASCLVQCQAGGAQATGIPGWLLIVGLLVLAVFILPALRLAGRRR
jgi:hypothetical protein